MKADAVFEGGGVKGIGLVGAICRFEEEGYRWQRLAGTSAGAIVAALLAAGYTGRELKKIIMELDYTQFQDRDKLQCIPLIGKFLGVMIEKGVYSGDKLEEWMEKMLKLKGRSKFKDVALNRESRLKIIATDITKRSILTLPDGLKEYGIDPMEFKISSAVRMSAGIPYYFKPVKLHYSSGVSYVVDGGLLSNFPVWLFDVDCKPRWPTFGFKLVEPDAFHACSGKTGAVSFLLDIIATMIEGNDTMYIKNKDMVRTVPIPTIGVGATDFDISREKNQMLFQSGYDSGCRFLDNWNFEKYINKYRTNKEFSRTKSLWAE